MRHACRLAIALGLSFPVVGVASRQQDSASTAKAAAQAPVAPAPKENAPAESAPAQKSPAETVPATTAPTTTAPAEQVPAETKPAEPAASPAPAAEKKPPDSEAKPKTDAAPSTGTSASGISPSGTPRDGTKKRDPRTAPAPEGAPRKIVVREGGASEPKAQIAPGMTPAEAARERQDAEQWLASSADKLKLLVERTLDAREVETVGQIRNYMDGARSALQDGDVRRANTLALKAHLLAEDLVKH